MINSRVKNAILGKLRISLTKTQYLAILLVLLPVLFINFGAIFSAAQLNGSDYVINYYSQNSVAFEVNRFSQSSVLEAIKYKRAVFSAFSLIPGPKCALNFKICDDINNSLILINIPHGNFKFKYLLSDLSPPFDLI